MDDNNITTLTEAQYEWALRLVNILSPLIHEGVQSIFNESWSMCEKEDELDKYLMTFQNLLSRVPQWNESIIETEVDRIVEKSGCTYLEDLLSCVHIVHLKILTTIRTGKTQKKIDIDIPKLNHFIHKIYINSSRSLYTRVYLFEKDVPPLTYQRNRADLGELIKQSIMDVVRDSIPVDVLLRAYLDESTDLVGTVKEPEAVKEEEKKTDNLIEKKKNELKALLSDGNGADKSTTDTGKESADPVKIMAGAQDDVSDKPAGDSAAKPVSLAISDAIQSGSDKNTLLSFSNTDDTIDTNKKEETVAAPKDIPTLEQISSDRYTQRKADEEDEDKITIHSGSDIVLTNSDVQDISIPAPVVNETPLVISDIEVLG